MRVTRVDTWIEALLIAVATLELAGCAALQQSRTRGTEELLEEAGFQPQYPYTEDELEQLAEMPPRQLVSRERNGEDFYEYADPDACRCWYVGGPDAYATYQRLVAEMDWRTQ